MWSRIAARRCDALTRPFDKETQQAEDNSMPVWTLIIWLIIGAAAGLAARRTLAGGPPGGLTGDLVLGIVGALLGGYGVAIALAPTLTGTVGGLLASGGAALVAGFALPWVARLATRSA
jgi:uncharacterized membrane protein YeaQ/YmgE (transglycosylase-associated protein family)